MIVKHAKFPWEVKRGEVIKNKDFKKAIKIYKNVKAWCEENCKKEYILDDTVYALGVRVSFKTKKEANKFERVFNP
jgi:hypothetical protein